MKILTIEVLSDHEVLFFKEEENKKYKKFPAVKLTVRKWFFWRKEINVYPVIDQYDSLEYVDDLGKLFSSNTNEQIYNYVSLKHIQKKI